MEKGKGSFHFWIHSFGWDEIAPMKVANGVLVCKNVGTLAPYDENALMNEWMNMNGMFILIFLFVCYSLIIELLEY